MCALSQRRRGTLIALGVVGMLLAAGFGSPIVTVAAGQQAQPEADNTVTRIHVNENGSARWTIQVRTRLDTADRVADYEAFQSRFEANKSRYLDPFRTRMRRVVDASANATGREMRAFDFSASTSIQEVPRRWGIVTFEFTWTHFAARTNGALVVGDVFQGGFFLAANDTLVVEAPDGYDTVGVAPEPDSRESRIVSWTGREDFSDRHPQVEFARQTGGDQTSSQKRSPSPPLGAVGPAVWLGGVIVLLVVLALVFGVYRRRVGVGRDGVPPEDRPAESAATVRMTDEEKVIDLLESAGGRLRQSSVAEKLDWSASKTSRVVGRMVEEGTVEKLQVGRENLLDLVDDNA